MRTLIYEYGEDDDVNLYFDYDVDIIEAIKTIVPYGHRRWSPERRRWIVTAAYWPRLRKLLEDYGIIDHVQEHARRQSLGASEYDVLHLRHTAPPEVVKAAYLAMVKLNHPDWSDGTDTDIKRRTDAMKKINNAYEAIIERVRP